MNYEQEFIDVFTKIEFRGFSTYIQPDMKKSIIIHALR